MAETKGVEIGEPRFAKFIFADTRFAWFWLIVRVFVGWQWLHAGWEKLQNPAWVGDKAGTALHGFLMGALKKASGEHPDVSGWYASFIQNVADHHVVLFSHLVTYGEILIGAALILGMLTGIAAFFGTFLNLNFLFAGAVSINPILLLFQIFLVLAWRIAGWIGVDRYLLGALGTPWQGGTLFNKNKQ